MLIFESFGLSFHQTEVRGLMFGARDVWAWMGRML